MEISQLIPVNPKNRNDGFIGIHHIEGNRVMFVAADLRLFEEPKKVMADILADFDGPCFPVTPEQLGIVASDASRQHYMFASTVRTPFSRGTILDRAAEWFRQKTEEYDRQEARV